MIRNFRLVKAIDSKLGQQEAPTWVNGWRKFQLYMSFDNKVMVLQVYEIGCVWKTPFRKSGHIFKCCFEKAQIGEKLISMTAYNMEAFTHGNI